MALNLALSRDDLGLRVAERYFRLPRWARMALVRVATALVHMEINRVSAKISENVLMLDSMTNMIGSDSDISTEQIDENGAIAANLASKIESSKVFHANGLALIRSAETLGNTHLIEASQRFTAICAEYHDAVASLAWAVAEHDASRAKRIEGYTGSTRKEIEDILDRIAAGG